MISNIAVLYNGKSIFVLIQVMALNIKDVNYRSNISKASSVTIE